MQDTSPTTPDVANIHPRFGYARPTDWSSQARIGSPCFDCTEWQGNAGDCQVCNSVRYTLPDDGPSDSQSLDLPGRLLHFQQSALDYLEFLGTGIVPDVVAQPGTPVLGTRFDDIYVVWSNTDVSPPLVYLSSNGGVHRNPCDLEGDGVSCVSPGDVLEHGAYKAKVMSVSRASSTALFAEMSRPITIPNATLCSIYRIHPAWEYPKPSREGEADFCKYCVRDFSESLGEMELDGVGVDSTTGYHWFCTKRNEETVGTFTAATCANESCPFYTALGSVYRVTSLAVCALILARYINWVQDPLPIQGASTTYTWSLVGVPSACFQFGMRNYESCGQNIQRWYWWGSGFFHENSDGDLLLGNDGNDEEFLEDDERLTESITDDADGTLCGDGDNQFTKDHFISLPSASRTLRNHYSAVAVFPGLDHKNITLSAPLRSLPAIDLQAGMPNLPAIAGNEGEFAIQTVRYQAFCVYDLDVGEAFDSAVGRHTVEIVPVGESYGGQTCSAFVTFTPSAQDLGPDEVQNRDFCELNIPSPADEIRASSTVSTAWATKGILILHFKPRLMTGYTIDEEEPDPRHFIISEPADDQFVASGGMVAARNGYRSYNPNCYEPWGGYHHKAHAGCSITFPDVPALAGVQLTVIYAQAFAGNVYTDNDNDFPGIDLAYNPTGPGHPAIFGAQATRLKMDVLHCDYYGPSGAILQAWIDDGNSLENVRVTVHHRAVAIPHTVYSSAALAKSTVTMTLRHYERTGDEVTNSESCALTEGTHCFFDRSTGKLGILKSVVDTWDTDALHCLVVEGVWFIRDNTMPGEMWEAIDDARRELTWVAGGAATHAFNLKTQFQGQSASGWINYYILNLYSVEGDPFWTCSWNCWKVASWVLGWSWRADYDIGNLIFGYYGADRHEWSWFGTDARQTVPVLRYAGAVVTTAVIGASDPMFDSYSSYPADFGLYGVDYSEAQIGVAVAPAGILTRCSPDEIAEAKADFRLAAGQAYFWEYSYSDALGWHEDSGSLGTFQVSVRCVLATDNGDGSFSFEDGPISAPFECTGDTWSEADVTGLAKWLSTCNLQSNQTLVFLVSGGANTIFDDGSPLAVAKSFIDTWEEHRSGYIEGNPPSYDGAGDSALGNGHTFQYAQGDSWEIAGHYIAFTCLDIRNFRVKIDPDAVDEHAPDLPYGADGVAAFPAIAE